MTHLFRIFLITVFALTFAPATYAEDGSGARVELYDGSGIYYYPFSTYNPRDRHRSNPRVLSGSSKDAPQPVPGYVESSTKRPRGYIGATPRMLQFGPNRTHLNTPRSMQARLTGYWPEVTPDLVAQSSYTSADISERRPVFGLSWTEAPWVYRGNHPPFYGFRAHVYGTGSRGGSRQYDHHRYGIIGYNNGYCRSRNATPPRTPYQPISQFDGDSFDYVPASLDRGIRHAGVVDDGIHDFTYHVSNPFGERMNRLVSFRVVFMGHSQTSGSGNHPESWWTLNSSTCVIVDTGLVPSVSKVSAASSRVTNDPGIRYTNRGPSPTPTLSHITITQSERKLENYIDYLVEFSQPVAHVASKNAGSSTNRAGFSSFTTDDFAFEFVSSDPTAKSIWMRPHVRPSHGTGRFDADCRNSANEPLAEATWQTVSAARSGDVNPERLRCLRWYVFARLGQLPPDFPVGTVYLRVRNDNNIRLVADTTLYPGSVLKGFNNMNSPRLRGYAPTNYQPWVINLRDSESIGLAQIRANAFSGESENQALYATNIERAPSFSSTGGSDTRGRSIMSGSRANGPTVNNSQKIWGPLTWRITFNRNVDIQTLDIDDFAVGISGATNEVNEEDMRDAATILNTATAGTVPVASGHRDAVVDVRAVVPVFSSANLTEIPKGNASTIARFDETIHALGTYRDGLSVPSLLPVTKLGHTTNVASRPVIHGARVFEVHAFANVPNSTTNLTLRYNRSAEFRGINATDHLDNVSFSDVTPTHPITNPEVGGRELGATDKAFYDVAAGDVTALALQPTFDSGLAVQRICMFNGVSACDTSNNYEPAANVVNIGNIPHYELQWRVRFNDKITDITGLTDTALDASRNFKLIDRNGNNYNKAGVRLDRLEFEATGNNYVDYLVTAVMPVASYGTSTGFGDGDTLGIELLSDAYLTDDTVQRSNRLTDGVQLHGSGQIDVDSRLTLMHSDFAISDISRHSPTSTRVPTNNQVTWKVTYSFPLSESVISQGLYLRDFRVVRRDNLSGNTFSDVLATESVTLTGVQANDDRTQVLITSQAVESSYSSNTGVIFLELKELDSFNVRSHYNTPLDVTTVARNALDFYNLDSRAMFVDFIRRQNTSTIDSTANNFALSWLVGFSQIPQNVNDEDFIVEVSSDSGRTYEVRPGTAITVTATATQEERQVRATNFGHSTTPLRKGDRIRLRLSPTHDIQQNNNTPLDISANNLVDGVYYSIERAAIVPNTATTCTPESIVSITRMSSTARASGHRSLTNERSFRWDVVFNQPIANFDTGELPLFTTRVTNNASVVLTRRTSGSTLSLTGRVTSDHSDGQVTLLSAGEVTCGTTDERLYTFDYTPPSPRLLTRDSGTSDAFAVSQVSSSGNLKYSFYFNEPVDPSTVSSNSFRILDINRAVVTADLTLASHRVGGSSRLANIPPTAYSAAELSRMQTELAQQSGTPYFINVGGLGGQTVSGVTIGLSSSATAVTDLAGNRVSNPTNSTFSHPLSQAGFNVDTHAPILESIVPVFGTENTTIFSRNLLFRAKFDTPVNMLDEDDFEVTFEGNDITLNGTTERLVIWQTNEASLTRGRGLHSHYWNIQVLSKTIDDNADVGDAITLSPAFTQGVLSADIIDIAGNKARLERNINDPVLNPRYTLESTQNHVTVSSDSTQDDTFMNFELSFSHFMNAQSVQPYNFTVSNAHYSTLRVNSHTPRLEGTHDFDISIRHNARHGDHVELHSIYTSNPVTGEAPRIRLSAYNPYGLTDYYFSPTVTTFERRRYQYASSVPINIGFPQALEIRVLNEEARDGVIASSMIDGQNLIWDILFNVSLTNLRTSNFVITNSTEDTTSAPTAVYNINTTNFYRPGSTDREAPDSNYQITDFDNVCVNTTRCWRVVKPINSRDFGVNILSPSESNPIRNESGNLRFFSSLSTDAHRASVNIDATAPVISSFRNAATASIRSVRPRWVLEFSEPVRKTNEKNGTTFAITAQEVTVVANEQITANEQAHIDNKDNITVTRNNDGSIYYIRANTLDFDREINLSLDVDLEGLIGEAGNALDITVPIEGDAVVTAGAGNSNNHVVRSPSVRLDLVDDAIYLYPLRLVGSGPELSTDSPLVQVDNQIHWRMYSARPFQTPITLLDQHGQEYVFECPTQSVTEDGCTGTQEIENPYFNNWQFTDGSRLTVWHADFVQNITDSTPGGVPDLHVVGELRGLTGAKIDYAAVHKAPFHVLERRLGQRPYSFQLNRGNKFHANEVFINAGPLVATSFERYPSNSHFITSFLNGTLFYELHFNRPPASPPLPSSFAIDVREVADPTRPLEAGTQGDLIPYSRYNTQFPAPNVSGTRCEGTVCILTIDTRSVNNLEADIFVRLLPNSGILPADYTPSQWLPNSESLFELQDGIESPRWRLGFPELSTDTVPVLSASADEQDPSASPSRAFSQAQQGSATSELVFNGTEASLTFTFPVGSELPSNPDKITIDGMEDPTTGAWSSNDTGTQYTYSFVPPASFYTDNSITFTTMRDEATGDFVSTSSSSGTDIAVAIETTAGIKSFTQSTSGLVSRYTQDVQLRGRDLMITVDFPTPLQAVPTSISLDGTALTTGSWEFNEFNTSFTYTFAPDATFYTQVISVDANNVISGDVDIAVDGFMVRSGFASGVPNYVAGSSVSFTKVFAPRDATTVSSSSLTSENKVVTMNDRVVINVHSSIPLNAAPGRIEIAGTTDHPSGAWHRVDNTNTHYQYSFALTRYFPPNDGPLEVTISEYYTGGDAMIAGAPFSFTTQPDFSSGSIGSSISVERAASLVAVANVPLGCENSVVVSRAGCIRGDI